MGSNPIVHGFGVVARQLYGYIYTQINFSQQITAHLYSSTMIRKRFLSNTRSKWFRSKLNLFKPIVNVSLAFAVSGSLFAQSNIIYHATSPGSNTLTNVSDISNTGTDVVGMVYENDADGNPSISLRGFCWDGPQPSFAVEFGGLVLEEMLDGNNHGLPYDPDIAIDPRMGSVRNIIITYMIDSDSDINNNSPSDVYYEVWQFDGTTLNLAMPASLVPSNWTANKFPNVDVSAIGQVAIVYQSAYNSFIVGMDDINFPGAFNYNNGISQIDEPCINLCSSWRPDVALIYDPVSDETKAATCFLWSESQFSPTVPYFMSERSIEYDLIGQFASIPCDVDPSAYNVLYQTTEPEHFIGIPRIATPATTENQAHLNDFHVVVNTVEDADIGGLSYILSYSKRNNGPVVFEAPSTNNYVAPNIPGWWTSITFPSLNPFYQYTLYNGNYHNINLNSCTNYNPACAFRSDAYVDAWHLVSEQFLGPEGGYPFCSNTGDPQHLSAHGQIVARQIDQNGSVSNPAVSIVSEPSNTALESQVFISVAGRFDPQDRMLYFYWATGTGDLLWESHGYQSENLKTNRQTEVIAVEEEAFFVFHRATQQLELRSNEETPVHLQLFDMTGRLAWQKQLNLSEGSTFIPLTSLPKGMYVLHSTDGAYSGKLIN